MFDDINVQKRLKSLSNRYELVLRLCRYDTTKNMRLTERTFETLLSLFNKNAMFYHLARPKLESMPFSSRLRAK